MLWGGKAKKKTKKQNPKNNNQEQNPKNNNQEQNLKKQDHNNTPISIRTDAPTVTNVWATKPKILPDRTCKIPSDVLMRNELMQQGYEFVGYATTNTYTHTTLRIKVSIRSDVTISLDSIPPTAKFNGIDFAEVNANNVKTFGDVDIILFRKIAMNDPFKHQLFHDEFKRRNRS